MKDERKAKKQLVDELAELRQRVAELETAETERVRSKEERARAEDALRESEERYRLLFENVTDVVYSIDLESRVLSVSPSVERLLGYTPDELIGKRFPELDVLAPEYLETALSDTMHILAGEQIASSVYEFIAKDGTKKFGEVSGAPLVRDGKVVGVISVARDITERVRSEEERAQAEEVLRWERDLAEALGEATAALTATLDLDQVLDRILEQASRVVPGDAANIMLIEGGEARIVRWRGYERFGAEEFVSTVVFHITEMPNLQHMLESGEPMIIPDTAAYPNWVNAPVLEWLRSYAAVPIVVRGEVLGFLNVDSATPDFFTQAHLGPLRAFADHAAAAIENARVYEAEQKRHRVAETLRQASAVLSSTLELDKVLGLILQQLRQVIPCDTISVQLLQDEHLEIMTCQGFEKPDEVVGLVFPLDPKFPNYRVITTKAPLAIEDVIQDYPHFQDEADTYVSGRIRSWLGMPLVVKDQVIGMVALDRVEVRPYTAEETQLAMAFASQAAIAIENARLFQHAHTRAEEQAVLNELGQALTALLDVGQVLDAAYRGASCLVDTANFYIILCDQDKDEITFALDVVDGEVQKPNVVHQASQGLAEYVIRSRTPLLIKENLPEQLKERGIELLGRPALSWVGVPLVIGDRVLGMMAAIQSNAAARAYDEHDRDLLTSIASQVAIALQNASLFQETQRRIAQLTLINDVGGKIAAVLDLDSVLDRAVRLAQESFGYHHVAIFTLNSERDELVMGARVGDFAHLFPPDHRLKLGQGMVGWAGYYGKNLLANDVDAEPRYVNLYPDVIPTRSELSVPIGVGGEVVGVFDVQSPQLDAFDENDVMVMEIVADQVAIAIENARLHSKVLDHAELLEQRVRERTAQLAAERARLEAILRSTADGIVVTDAEGEVLRANPVAQTWLTQTLSPEDTGQLQEMIRSVAARTEKRPVELLELTGLDLELSGAPILEPEMEDAFRLSQGQPATVVDIHDVSHMKALDRMKTRFITNISHELRTPITTIKLYAHLMRQQPEKWEKYLSPLTEEANRQAQLVAGILEISDIDAGRLEMDPRPTPLDELVEVSVAGRQVMAQDKGLTLEHRPASPASGGGAVALVDPERMMQVLYNLVENAIHYTPEGGKVVVFTGKQEAEGRTWATVTVEDTGMGIPEEEFPHIFDRFYRGVEPRAMQISGTGLGLAIVEEIVELHGGRVTVESEEDVGSTFTVWLPLSE